jgi:hypothetical protein
MSTVVNIDQKGRVIIPKSFREKANIKAPGKPQPCHLRMNSGEAPAVPPPNEFGGIHGGRRLDIYLWVSYLKFFAYNASQI